MASLTLAEVTKHFGRKAVLRDVSLRVEEGAFMALLGPSGCGKSTLLRLVAGFERVDRGEIALDGRTVSSATVHVPTEARKLGMVFQSYALWPHMSVFENVAFALDVAGIAPKVRRARVEQALETVGLGALAARRPADLSGGQRQRVALARTLAARARIILLDEPLANLDANLRESMQEEFRRLHRETGATMVFVTHDQAEALALADQVAVMMEGQLRQIAAPRALYDRPADADVARFIGRGAIVEVLCLAAGEDWAEVAIGPSRLRLRAGPGAQPGPAQASLRPEGCRLVADAPGHPGLLRAHVRMVRFTGPAQLVSVSLRDLPECTLLATAAKDQQIAPGMEMAIAVDDGWVLGQPAR